MQFARASSPALPDRAALFSVAPRTEADFSAAELRCVKKKVKKKRAGGSDTLSIEVEYFHVFLNVLLPFSHSSTNVGEQRRSESFGSYGGFQPSAKRANTCTNQPVIGQYRIFKYLIICILQWLSPGLEDRVWKFQQYGFQSGFSVDDAIFAILRVLEILHNPVGLPIY